MTDDRKTQLDGWRHTAQVNSTELYAVDNDSDPTQPQEKKTVPDWAQEELGSYLRGTAELQERAHTVSSIPVCCGHGNDKEEYVQMVFNRAWDERIAAPIEEAKFKQQGDALVSEPGLEIDIDGWKADKVVIVDNKEKGERIGIIPLSKEKNKERLTVQSAWYWDNDPP